MINDVVLEGIVPHTWQFADDLLFRLACYHDPDQTTKLFSETQNATDFMTILVSKDTRNLNID